MQTNPTAVQEILAKTQGVTLVAATKYIDSSQLASLYENGVHIFGENRVQALLEKYRTYNRQATWHFIGTLQTNKVKDIIDKVKLIHSVNTYHLIDEIQKQAAKNGLIMPILLEVNIANEPSKQGFCEEEIPYALTYLKRCPNVLPKGLMMMAPHIAMEETRPYFKKTRLLLKNMQQMFPEFELTELSMGMSGDYPIAIEEGATIIRIGKALFKE